MKHARTCLVLGAGASRPYLLPTGAELRQLLLSGFIDKFDRAPAQFQPKADPALEQMMNASGAQRWFAVFRRVCQIHNIAEAELSAFQKAFFEARRGSIDAFLQKNDQEWGVVGRLLIATVLLHCEEDKSLDRDWYGTLFDDVFPSSEEDLASDQLSVLTFNYDRSFEQFFRSGLNGFNISRPLAQKAFSKIKIKHVYGMLGSLDDVSYGNTRGIGKVFSNIHTIRTNEVHEDRAAINQMIGEVENVVFIGFGFAPENLLLFDAASFRGKCVTATTYGLTPNNVAAANQLIEGLSEFPGTGSQLLQSKLIRAPLKPKPSFDFEPLEVNRASRVEGI